MTRVNAKELLMLRAAGPQAIQLLAIEAALGVRRDGEGRPAEAVRQPGFGARLRDGLQRIAAGVARARRRNRAIAELSKLDDRMLNDIGIERGCIVEAVDATMERRAPAWAVIDLGRSLVEPLVRPILRWRRDAVTLGELGQLDDHLLADIGVTRGDLHFQPQLVLQRAHAANANRAQPRAA
ncbi:MAG TPA: DUF1127 domain-containing protein [Kiloniellales bacterium]|nr:DUF1127 domain-containing protein [Kiloniellales bacterium]